MRIVSWAFRDSKDRERNITSATHGNAGHRLKKSEFSCRPWPETQKREGCPLPHIQAADGSFPASRRDQPVRRLSDFTEYLQDLNSGRIMSEFQLNPCLRPDPESFDCLTECSSSLGLMDGTWKQFVLPLLDWTVTSCCKTTDINAELQAKL